MLQPPGCGRVLRVLDVTDERVELAIADRLARELRHHVRPAAHGLRDLNRRRVRERRHARAGRDASACHDLVAPCAVVDEEAQALGDARALRMRLRDRRAGAEATRRSGRAPDLPFAEQHAPAGRLVVRDGPAACSPCGCRSRPCRLRRSAATGPCRRFRPRPGCRAAARPRLARRGTSRSSRRRGQGRRARR